MELERSIIGSWRKFHISENGIAGMLWLREQEPSVNHGDSHAMLFDAGRVQGYKDCLDKISQLLSAPISEVKPLESSSDLEQTR